MNIISVIVIVIVVGDEIILFGLYIQRFEVLFLF